VGTGGARGEALGVRSVVVRTGVVLAYDGGALVAQLPQYERGVGAIVLPGSEWMPWIHIADEVGIIIRCLEDERVRGPISASAPHPVRQRKFAKTVGRVLGAPVRMRLPGFVLKLAMGEPARAILYNHRMIPPKMLAIGYTFVFPDFEEAARDVLAHARRPK
jgi:NAD dependent epimerase/dehydratase family enzyme